ncbi:MAG: methyltransferase family protein [bacterium]
MKKNSPLRRIGGALAKVCAFFIILEPIWMLLPFAGFLYGSVFQIQMLNQNPRTAWLTHFVFPILTLGWTGPVLIAVGFILFLIGAAQIYWAKIRGSGLVTQGIYRFVRHPQYISLTLLGIGILLSWGRAIAFIMFFIMMLLYYYLTKSEEQRCIQAFGDAYGHYRTHTSFIIPGDKFLRPLHDKMPHIKMPGWFWPIEASVLTILTCFALMWLINSIKVRIQKIPYMTTAIPLAASDHHISSGKIMRGEAHGIPFVQEGRMAIIRGPHRNARVSGFAERLIRRVRESNTLAHFLAFLDESNKDVAIIWCGPYKRPAETPVPGSKARRPSDSRGPALDPYGPERVRLILMQCRPSEGAQISDILRDASKREIISSCVAQVNLALPEGEDIVEADGLIRGAGFPGEARWDFFLKQFSHVNRRDTSLSSTTFTLDHHANARLVLIQAPILKTRTEPDFAQEIFDRLRASETFKQHLRKAGVGGDTIAVAFPRPGRNWYHEHHRKPEISLFIILSRLIRGENASLDDLFLPDSRELVSAFSALMDFKIIPPSDSIVDIWTIGPRRDLEERWRFFLSGVGISATPGTHKFFFE